MKKITLIFIFIFSFCFIESKAQVIERLPNTIVNLYYGPFVNSGGKMFFEGYDGNYDIELWVTDGTAAGSHLTKDINQSVSHYSNIGDLTDYHNKLYFRADDSAHGYELWVSDGTSAGTHLVKDISPDTLDSYPMGLTICNDTLFFAANDSEIWKTDGTTTGTKRVKKINKALIRKLGVFNNKLYFRGTLGGLWVSDGTTAGTQMVYENLAEEFHIADYWQERPYLVYNNKIYFEAYTYSMGYELWQSDGTTSGTNVLKDVELGFSGCDPFFGTIYHDTLFFIGWATGADDRAIIKSDGTEIGTNIFGDFGTVGIGSSLLGGFVEYQNNLYFSGRDDWNIGGEPYFTDGTVSGIHLLKDINLSWDNENSDPHAFKVFHNKLYFIATDSGNYDSDLWETDGTTNGTIKLILPNAIYTDPFANNVYGFHEYNNALYFMANYDTGTNIWRIVDSATTTEIGNINKVKEQISVYPNPATNQLTVQSVGSQQYAAGRVEITNYLGITVYAESVNLKSEIINLKSFASGIYFIKLYFGDGGMEVKKFVKE